MTRYSCLALLMLACQTCRSPAAESSPAMETNAAAVARCLATLDTWILAPPKCVAPLPGVAFDLALCKGILVEGADKARAELEVNAVTNLENACGVRLPILKRPDSGPGLKLVLAGTVRQFTNATSLGGEVYAQIGEQGYALVISPKGVVLAARALPGLRHALTTLAQIAADRATLPGLTIADWPSLKYRGAQQDISRGQVPTPATLKRLASVLALAKMNVLELYIEHEFQYHAFPDLSPPEGLTPEAARDLAADAARQGVEVHPFLQTLGHSYQILKLPRYEHLRVGPCEKAPWEMTFDITKPEAVNMVTTMIDELCGVFPGELFSVDITEIDIDGLKAKGIAESQVTELVFQYVLHLNEAVKKHGKRLLIAQGPLDSQGHLSGLGPKLDALPKGLLIGSYYCAGGPYAPAWEKDFPRLQARGIDFFAQPWIYSHVWLTPWVNRAAEFSNLEVSRGLKHGALGSVTADWGDAGHFHFVGEEWLPFLYHGACAWSGAQLDRDYFRKAFARVVYGLPDDAAIRAIEAVSDINAKTVRVRDKEGKESDFRTSYIWEFVHDPFTHPDLTRLTDPWTAGKTILEVAAPAFKTISTDAARAPRNRSNLEQWAFGARCYAVLGRKLSVLGHYQNQAVARSQVADELDSVAKDYESLQLDFKRLWLAEDRLNDGFDELVKRFTYTAVPCRQKAEGLRGK